MEKVTLTNIDVHPSNGLNETIAQMNYLESLSFQKQSFIKFIYEKFDSNCQACIPGKIWNFMKNNFQYVTDDPYDERLTAPYMLLQTKKGDCDDFALFSKTVLDVLGGWYTNYLLLGKNRNAYTHIVTFAHRGIIGKNYIDPVVIDGANANFNIINKDYKYYKFI